MKLETRSGTQFLVMDIFCLCYDEQIYFTFAPLLTFWCHHAGTTKAASEATVASLLPSASIPGQMTREELERHLDAKQNVFDIEKATASLPMDIFSNDNSNHAR